MDRYSRTVTAEVRLIDRVVAAAFDTFGRAPELFAGVSTLYFAAATTCEQRWGRSSTGARSAFLLADDACWHQAVTRIENSLHACRDIDGSDGIRAFQREVADAIAPYNLVGLCDPSARNMYRYTAAPK